MINKMKFLRQRIEDYATNFQKGRDEYFQKATKSRDNFIACFYQPESLEKKTQ
jgi:hypothetical protein